MPRTSTPAPCSRAKSVSKPENAQSVNFGQINTPELYFGYEFARAKLGNAEGYQPGKVVAYTIPDGTTITPNRIYLQGEWQNNADNMELQSEMGRIVLSYTAKSVNIVGGGSGKLYISEDGLNLTTGSRGSDVSDKGEVLIDGQKLYNIATHDGYGNHQIVIDVIGTGFQIYTFTFG